tara:strand:+ start:458 stop:1147 length:690 start_codon:yes stop_codon:yes gene_type:complete
MIAETISFINRIKELTLNNMEKVAFIGAGVLGKQSLQIASVQKKYEAIGFYDDYATLPTFEGLPILGEIDQIESDYKKGKFSHLFISIGYDHLKLKQELFRRFSAIPFASIIHPSVIIEDSATIDGGVLIYAGCYIGPNCHMKTGTVLNLMSYLAHDSTVGECTFVSGGINVGGKVNFGERCFVGIGTTLVDEIEICNDVFIGAGTVVVKTISESGTYIGCPARKLDKK